MFYSYGGLELLGKTREDEQNLSCEYSLCRNFFCDFSSFMHMSSRYQEYGWKNVESDSIVRKTVDFFLNI